MTQSNAVEHVSSVPGINNTLICHFSFTLLSVCYIHLRCITWYNVYLPKQLLLLYTIAYNGLEKPF